MLRMSPHRRPCAGYTLVELMIASAIGTLVVCATFATLTLQNTLHRNTDKHVSTHYNSSLGLSVLARDLENAAYHFSVPGLSIRARDNVAAPLPNGDGTTVNFLAGATFDAGTSGVISGTDVVETISGNANSTQGQVVAVTTTGTTSTVTLWAIDPLVQSDIDALNGGADGGITAGPMLAFQAANGLNCLGKVTAVPQTSPSVQVTVTILPDLEGNVTGSGSAVAGCPAIGMSVYALTSRARYMVYQDVNGTVGIFVQRSQDSAGTTRLGALGPPTLLVEGVEDMQMSWNIGNGMWCNTGTTMDGGSCDVAANLKSIQGVNVNVVSRGTDLLQKRGASKPALFNGAAGSADHIVRSVATTSIFLRNIIYVR